MVTGIKPGGYTVNDAGRHLSWLITRIEGHMRCRGGH